MSVGEWLNSVIQRSDGDGEDPSPGRPQQHDRERIAFGAPGRGEGGPYREAGRGERQEHQRQGYREEAYRDDGYREADYSGRPERRREAGAPRASDRSERYPRRPERNHSRNTEYTEQRERPRQDVPYRDLRRDVRYSHRHERPLYRDTHRAEPHTSYRDAERDPRDPQWHERQGESQSFRNVDRDERREAARDSRSDRDNFYAEPHAYGPASDRATERDERQELQPDAAAAVFAERDAPPEGRPESSPSRDAEAGEPHERRDAGIGNDRERVARKPRETREDTPRRTEFDEVNARLDKLGQQLERLARVAVAPPQPPQPQQPPPVEARTEPIDPPLTGAPTPVRKAPNPRRDPPVAVAPPVREAPREPHDLSPAVPPAQWRRASAEPAISIDDAVAEIAARQRVLDGGAAVADETAAVPQAQAAESPPPAAAAAPVPVLDFESLEQQLRQITARIEALQPSHEIEKAIAAVRSDLAEIGKQLNEALPRRAVELLESEIKGLAERIDFSRQAGVNPDALAGLERGLAEVRDALRGLTPAENLIGADAAVNALAQKVDMILARDDPAMLQQLEAAIGGLRGVAAHVASNDTLNKVAEDVRVLAAQVDAIANNAATAHAVASLEQRIDALAAALQASSEAGQAVPRDLEKLLAGLIDKLEWVQLTHTDHAALAHLEDRIAMLVKRFDASEARFGQLEAIERGLADLLVHIEQTRGTESTTAAAPAAWQAPSVRVFAEPAAAIAPSEPRAHERPATMQDAVEHVADRLAMIESNLYDSATPAASAPPAEMSALAEPPPEPPQAAAAPVVSDAIVSLLAAAPAAPIESAAAIAPPAAQPAARPPLDPTLPPDHPLEVGFTSARSRPTASAAERVAASEAAIGSAKPPVIPDAGRPNFIAAARRAAQAAAWEPSTAKARQEPELAEKNAQPSKLTQRLRKLIVAASALLIVVGCARIAMRLLDSRTISTPAPIQTQQIPAPAAPAPAPLPQKSAPAKPAPAQAPALALPDPPGAALPPVAPAPAKAVKPEQQSLQQDGAHETVVNAAPPAAAQPGANALPLWATPDITGTLPRGIAGPAKPRAAAPAAIGGDDNLPASLGDPTLRAAAIGGDPAAAYEVAVRFAEGRGVPKDNAQAAHWLERAAKQGLVPAQFRLGGLYEKGIGVKKDLVRARDLYLAAAQKGNGKAMHNLAVLYAEGVDGAPDYTSAAEWFRRGADHGVSDSQYNLGILYGRGIGVSQNYAESYKWFALAANQGDPDAAGKRDEVAGHLDAKALDAARAAVQNFKPEPQPDEAIAVKTAAAWQSPATAK